MARRREDDGESDGGDDERSSSDKHMKDAKNDDADDEGDDAKSSAKSSKERKSKKKKRSGGSDRKKKRRRDDSDSSDASRRRRKPSRKRRSSRQSRRRRRSRSRSSSSESPRRRRRRPSSRRPDRGGGEDRSRLPRRPILGTDTSESSEFEHRSLARKPSHGDHESDSDDSYVGYAKMLRLRERAKPIDPTAHLEKVGRHVKLPRDFDRVHASVVARLRTQIDLGIITPTELCDPLMLNRLASMAEPEAMAVTEQFLSIDLRRVRNKASSLSRIIRKFLDEKNMALQKEEKLRRIEAKADRTAAAAAAADARASMPEQLPDAAAAVFAKAASAVADAEGDDPENGASAAMDDDLPDYEEPDILA